MNSMYVTVGQEKMNLSQLLEKVRNYDLSLSRNDIMDLIGEVKESHPHTIPAILSTVKSTYHLNIAI